MPQQREHSVSGRFLADFLRLLASRDVEVGDLVAGLVGSSRELREGHVRVPWDVFVELLERLEAEVGSREGLESLGESVSRARPAPVLRRLAGLSASPEILYRAGQRWALRRAMPMLDSRIERAGAARLRIVCAVPPPLRPCPQLFHMATGVLRATPRILDLPDARVVGRVGSSRAEWAVLLPHSGTLVARLQRAARALFSARAAFSQLELQEGELQEQLFQLRAAYAVLEESEARHRTLAEAAVDLVLELEPDGSVAYASPSVATLTGYAPDELVGHDLGEWIHPDDHHTARQALEGAVIETSYERQSQLRVRVKKGGWLPMEGRGRAYHTADGELRVVGIFRDVSERLRLEREGDRQREELEAEVGRRTAELERRNRELRELQSLLLRAERLGTAGELATELVHAVRTPLGALVGQLQWGLREVGDEGRPALERALALALRLGDVVHGVLGLYRDEKLDLRPADPGELLRELDAELEGAAVLHGVQLHAECEPGVPPFAADRPLLLAALAAIAHNALEALPSGHRLELSARNLPAEDAVELRVEDDGPGLAEARRDAAFDPFRTTGADGGGLGLAIARRVAEAHGGGLELASRPDVAGTRVILRLPRGGAIPETDAP